jgi:superfamily II DNA or RNA helicase
VSLVDMITELVENETRNNLIVKLVEDARKKASSRQVLVLSERRTHCIRLHEKFPDISGLYMGSMKKEDLDKSKQKPIIFGTFQQAHEGLDIATLDTVILATPKSDIKQSVGRILRETDGKRNFPLIIDLIDTWGFMSAMFNKRRRVYKECGFTIQSGGGPPPSSTQTKLTGFRFKV